MGPGTPNRRPLRARIKRLLRRRRRRAPRVQDWEAKWSSAAYEPPWQGAELPHEVQEAIDSNDFVAGGKIVDIGCGTGELANLLAARGFDTLGVDIAPSAIEMARERFPGHNPSFRVADICGPDPDLGIFDALIDHGCFHGLDRSQRAGYARNVASLCSSGAPFLMMTHVGNVPPRERVQQVRDALGEAFEIERTERTLIGSRPGAPGIEGIAFWMRRR